MGNSTRRAANAQHVSSPENCTGCLLAEYCFGPAAQELTREERKFRKGQHLFLEGFPARGIFCIREGLVKMSRSAGYKKEFIISFPGPGDVIGMESVLSSSDLLFSACALEPVHACFIPGRVIGRLLASAPGFSGRLIRYLCDRTSVVEKRITGISGKGIKAQLAELLLAIEAGDQPGGSSCRITCSLRDIAFTLGTTPNYLYKILSELASSRIISIENRKLRIARPELLARIAVG
jgi:CRP-like cAMP-binding protein